MREFLFAAFIVTIVGGGLSIPLGYLVAKMAIAGPPKWLRRQRQEAHQVEARQLMQAARSTGIIGYGLAQTSATSVVYISGKNLTLPEVGADATQMSTIVFDGGQIAA
jgi:hypothetical protein